MVRPAQNFDLIIETLPDGMVLLTIDIDCDAMQDLDMLERGGMRWGMFCGGCARKALAFIVDRLDLAVARYYDDAGIYDSLDTAEARQNLLAQFSGHIH